MNTDPIHITISPADAPIITDALRKEIALLTTDYESANRHYRVCVRDGLKGAAQMNLVLRNDCERCINTLRKLLNDIQQ